MTDPREAILARLVDIAGGVDGVVKAARNVSVMTEGARPAVIIFDADEAAENADPVVRSNVAHRRIEMSPEVHILMAGQPADVGTAVNMMRAAVIKAILTDGQWATILGTNGHVRYDGLISEFADGRTLQARMRLGFTFLNFLRPEEL